MNNLKYTIIIIVATFILTGCNQAILGEKVEVPPAHVGKILTKNGFSPDTIPPSKFRLPRCIVWCDRLVLLEASDTMMKESFDLFMPMDELRLGVEVRGTFTIPSDPQTVGVLMDRLTTTREVNSVTSLIPARSVYETYGRQAIRGVARSELVKYTIEDILSNRDGIGQNIHAAITERLRITNTPIVVSRFELAAIDPPQVIVAAQEAAKEREIDIQRAEADAEVAMVEADRALEIARKNRLVERERAESIAEQNNIAAESVTPQLLAYRQLEVAENIYRALAESDNVIIVPADASSFSNLTDDAVLARMLGREFKGN